MPIVLPALRDLPKEFRVLAALVMLGLALGYAHAIVYVYVTTHIAPKGVEERYRGSEETEKPAGPILSRSADTGSVGIGSPSDQEVAKPDTTLAERHSIQTPEIQYPKSFAEMLNIIHTHIVTMTLIFAISGLIVSFTRSTAPWLRRLIVVEPFFGIIATFGGLWATRFIAREFSWIVSASGALMALAFAMQCVAVVLELRASREKPLPRA